MDGPTPEETLIVCGAIVLLLLMYLVAHGMTWVAKHVFKIDTDVEPEDQGYDFPDPRRLK